MSKEIRIDPKEIYERIYLAGTEWSSAKQEAEFLEENKKSFRSKLICDHLDKEGSKKMSMAEAEARALADPEYVNYIKGMTMARRTSDDYDVKYKASLNWFSALQTRSSNERTQKQVELQAGKMHT